MRDCGRSGTTTTFDGGGECDDDARGGGKRRVRRPPLPDDDVDGRRGMRGPAGRLGMFFSRSSIPGGGNNIMPPLSDDVDVVPDVPARGTGTATTTAVPPPSSSSSVSARRRFDAFLARNNRRYIPDSEEYRRRMSIHDANVESISRWNEEHAGMTTFVPNEFMDMEVGEVLYFRGGVRRRPRERRRGGGHDTKGDASERRRQRGFVDENDEGGGGTIVERGGDNLRGTLSRDGATTVVDNPIEEDDDDEYKRHDVRAHRVPEDFDVSTLPPSFDWREHRPGSIGPVKDQGFCGSCWAFSLASALETNWFVATGRAVDVPEQFIVDCAWDDDSSGCDGGNSDSAAKRIVKRFRGFVPTREFVHVYATPNAQYSRTHAPSLLLGSAPHRLSFAPFEISVPQATLMAAICRSMANVTSIRCVIWECWTENRIRPRRILRRPSYGSILGGMSPPGTISPSNMP